MVGISNSTKQMIDAWDLQKLNGVTADTTISDPAWREVSDFILSESSNLSSSEKVGYALWAVSEMSQRYNYRSQGSPPTLEESFYDESLYLYAFSHMETNMVKRVVIPSLDANKAFHQISQLQKRRIAEAIALNDNLGFALSLKILRTFAPTEFTSYISKCSPTKASLFVIHHLKYPGSILLATAKEEMKKWATVHLLEMEDEDLPDSWVVKMLELNEKNFTPEGGRQ